jgi:hypothetical protein
MARGRRHLFIYYRLAAEQTPAALAAARSAQRALCARHAGLHAALMQRPPAPSEGERTLMETYGVDEGSRPQGLDAPLIDEIEAVMGEALSPWLAPLARHTELFEDTCAS